MINNASEPNSLGSIKGELSLFIEEVSRLQSRSFYSHFLREGVCVSNIP